MDVWQSLYLSNSEFEAMSARAREEIKQTVLSCRAALIKTKGKHRGQALICLRKLLEDYSGFQRPVVETIGLEILIRLLQDSRMREQTLALLEQLCTDEETRLQLGDRGIIRVLLWLLSERDRRTVHGAIRLLDALAAEDENQQRIIQDGGVQRLLSHENSGDKTIRDLLKSLSRHVQYDASSRHAPLSQGSSGPLRGPVQEAKKKKKPAVCGLLARKIPWDQLTSAEKNNFLGNIKPFFKHEHQLQMLVDSGCISFLTSALATSSSSEASKICETLSLFAKNPAYQDQMIQGGVIKAVMTQIHSMNSWYGPPATLLELLCLNPTYQNQMIQEGVIEAVARSILPQSPSRFRRCLNDQDLTILWALSKNDEARREVMKIVGPRGIVGSTFLVARVDDRGVRLRERLSECEEMRAELQAARHAYIVEMVRSLDPSKMEEIESSSVLTQLADFLSHQDNQADVVQAGGLDALLDLLLCTRPAIQLNVHEVLLSFAQHHAYRHTVLHDRRVLDSVLNLLAEDRIYHVSTAFTMLDYLLNTGPTDQVVRITEDDWTLPLLRAYAHGEKKAQLEAAKKLEVLAHVPYENFVRLWLKHLSDGDELIRRRSAEVLMRCGLRRACQELVAIHGLPLLIPLVSAEDEGMRELAFTLLANITLHPKNEAIVLNSGLMETLSELLCSEESAQQKSVMPLLAALVTVDAYRAALEALGVLRLITARSAQEAEAAKLLGIWEEQGRLLDFIRQEKESVESGCSTAFSASDAQGLPRIDDSLLKLGKRLGRSAWGRTWRSTYQDRAVVVKTYASNRISEKDAEDLLEMLERIHDVNSQHVLRLLGVVEPKDAPPRWVMPWGSGGSLDACLHGRQEIEWSWRMRVAQGLASGLAHLHEHHIIHKNIKSLNVILDEAGQPQWTDVGFSAWRGRCDNQDIPQSVRWMAPEFISDACATKESDVWAFGMLMFELISRTHPYSALKAPRAMCAILSYQMPVILSHQMPVVNGADLKKVPPFASLMRECFNRPDARPPATQLVEILSEMALSSEEAPSVG